MLKLKDIVFHVYADYDEICSCKNEIEILYVLKGKALISFEKNKDIQSIVENDILLLNSFEMHRIILEKGCRILSLVIGAKFITALLPEMEHVKFYLRSYVFGDEQQEQFDLIRADFARLFFEYYKVKNQQWSGIRCRAAELLYDLVQFFGKKDDDDVKSISSRERLFNVIQYIDKHYAENISLNEMAKRTFLTRNYLSHLFKKQIGSTYTEYLTNVRLQNAIMRIGKKETITNIAVMTGFPSTNAFIRAFKEHYGITPGQYRKQKIMPEDIMIKSEVQELSENSHLFDKLASYSKQKTDKKTLKKNTQVCQVAFNADCKKDVLKHNWHFCINGGYAKEMLLGNVQSAIAKIQKEIHYSFIRVKGIFDNGIAFCNRDQNGMIQYNYGYIDQLIDFILSVGAMPWLEFGYMPLAIASADKKVFTEGSTLSYPQKVDEWRQIIRTLIIHLKSKYGSQQIKRWIITPFVEMSVAVSEYMTMREYLEIFDISVNTVKEIEPEIQLAIGSNCSVDNDYGQLLVEHCNGKKIHIDYWIIQAYNYLPDGNELNIVLIDSTLPFAVSSDDDYLKHEIARTKTLLQKNKLNSDYIIVSEWNSTLWQRDLCNDTCYKSCYLVKNILENYDSLTGISYWKVSDQSEELLPSKDLFHGGFGLLTRNGIPKASYSALQLLCRMGKEFIKKGSGYFITSDKDSIQIYLYNYCRYDTLYRYRHTSNISKTNRYNVFENKDDIQFNILINHLKTGKYTKKIYSINKNSGSSYDAWVKMGAPEQLSREEVQILMDKTSPDYFTEQMDVKDSCCIKSYVRPHEVQLITFACQE